MPSNRQSRAVARRDFFRMAGGIGLGLGLGTSLGSPRPARAQSTLTPTNP
jgi:hypothetical protein